MLLKYRAKSNRKLWWLIYVKNYSGIALDDVIWWELSTDFFFQQINYTLSLRNKRSPFYISLFSSWMRTSADWCCSKNKVQRIVERSILQTINNLTIQRKLGLSFWKPFRLKFSPITLANKEKKNARPTFAYFISTNCTVYVSGLRFSWK